MKVTKTHITLTLKEANDLGDAWRPCSRKLAHTYVPFGEFVRVLSELKDAGFKDVDVRSLYNSKYMVLTPADWPSDFK